MADLNRTWYYWHVEGATPPLAASLGESDQLSVALELARTLAMRDHELLEVRSMPGDALLTTVYPDGRVEPQVHASAGAMVGDDLAPPLTVEESAQIGRAVRAGQGEDEMRRQAGLPANSWRVPHYVVEDAETLVALASSQDEAQMMGELERRRSGGERVQLRCSVGWTLIDA